MGEAEAESEAEAEAGAETEAEEAKPQAGAGLVVPALREPLVNLSSIPFVSICVKHESRRCVDKRQYSRKRILWLEPKEPLCRSDVQPAHAKALLQVLCRTFGRTRVEGLASCCRLLRRHKSRDAFVLPRCRLYATLCSALATVHHLFLLCFAWLVSLRRGEQGLAVSVDHLPVVDRLLPKDGDRPPGLTEELPRHAQDCLCSDLDTRRLALRHRPKAVPRLREISAEGWADPGVNERIL